MSAASTGDRRLNVDLDEFKQLVEMFIEEIGTEQLMQASNASLALPPEERFAECIDCWMPILTGGELERHEEAGTAEGSPLPAHIYQRFNQIFNLLQSKVLRNVLTEPDRGTDYALLALFIDRQQRIFNEIDRRGADSDDKEAKRLLSTYFAAASRWYKLSMGEADVQYKDIAADIRWIDYSSKPPDQRVLATPPSERDTHDLVGDVVKEAAVLAYDHLDITVSRGAELAEISIQQFQQLLVDNDIRPRYGPTTPDELFE